MEGVLRTSLYFGLLIGLLVLCEGIDSIEDPKCECVNYNNEYMNCSCCDDRNSNYFYRIDYSSTESAVKQCDKGWASNELTRCDCLFCGLITDTSHPKYGLCKDMDNDTKPFEFTRTYYLNVTVQKNGVRANTGFNVNPLEVLKPPPVTILQPSSDLTNDSIVLKLKWKPGGNLEMLSDFKYFISWKKEGEEDAMQNTTTEDQELTITSGLEPNSDYSVDIKCRPIQNGYWSDAASVPVLTPEKCFERAPSKLNNHNVDYSKCQGSSNDVCAMVTVFWQRLKPDSQYANCKSYLLEVSGSFGNYSQNASCNDVMTLIKKPLPKGQAISVDLYTFSDTCVWPPSHMRLQTTKKPSAGRKMNVIALIFGVILSISLVLGCAGFLWWCVKHMRDKRTLLEKHRGRIRALSSVSNTTMEDYTQRWVLSLPVSENGDYIGDHGDPYSEVTEDVEKEPDITQPIEKQETQRLHPLPKERKRCPEVLAKWRRKWDNVLQCAAKPSPGSDKREQGDNSQRTPLTDVEQGTTALEPANSIGLAEADLIATELHNMGRELPQPNGDSGFVRSPSKDNVSKVPSRSDVAEAGSSVGIPDSVRSPSPVQTVSDTQDPIVKPKTGLDGESDPPHPPGDPSGDPPGDTEGRANDSGPGSENGLPSYPQFAGSSDDYKKLPEEKVSDELMEGNSLSEDEESDLDISDTPFKIVIPSQPGGQFNA